MKKSDIQKIIDLEKFIKNVYSEDFIFSINLNGNFVKLENEKLIKEQEISEKINDSNVYDKLRKKIEDYNELVLRAYDLLSQANKPSLISVLQYCCINKDIKVTKILSEEELKNYNNQGKNFTITVSKGNLMLEQEDWSQSTCSKSNTVASDRKIYKDTNSEKHIKLVFDYQVPNTILRELNLNSKKQVPMITTLQGFEPYNLMDLSNDEYIKQKTESDAKAIIYSERYKDHINLLINKSPYQAANAFLLLQSNINMKIQECIRDILAQGNILTVDSLIHYSFENIAEATRELFTKYHAFNTTEEEKLKITRFIALYFAVVEEADNNVDNYVKSLNEKYGIVKNE